MNNFSYENQGSNTYLVYSINADEVIDSMSLGMITNNKIHGLASTLFMQIDMSKYIKYNISSKISVRQFFAGPVNKKRLIGVFKGIVNAMLSAEEYMLDESGIILDLDYIFADVSTCETVLICLPIQNKKEMHDLGAFFKGIMFTTQFDQTENCDYVARIINYLNSTPLFSLLDFKHLLEEIEKINPVDVPTITVKPVEVDIKPVKQPVVQPKSAEMANDYSVPNVNPQPTVVPPVRPNVVPAPIPAVRESKPATVVNGKNEKEITWFYLMQHYNKENAEIYKAQKEAKKNAGKAPATLPAPATSKPQKQSKAQKKPAQAPAFAIPGQEVPVNKPVIPVQPVVNTVPPQQIPVNVQPAVQKTQPVVEPVVQPVVQTSPAYVPREDVAGKPNFGETTVLGAGSNGETTVLKVANVPNQVVAPHLIRAKNNEKISLNKPVFRIGKERSYVDYFIGDNTAVSRSHANIVARDGEYFVVDMNSTNHTFVNGNMISSSVEVKIEHGAKLMFGNEEFEFKVY